MLSTKEKETDFLIALLSYISNDPDNLEKVLMVIGNAVEANQVVLSFSPMTEKEALEPCFSDFKDKLTTRVENGVETILIARDSSQWQIPCQLAFGILAALTTMVRNDVLDHCSDENMIAYRKFIKVLKKSAISGTEAISYTD